jgi:CRISPR system Cascade subunit CasA
MNLTTDPWIPVVWNDGTTQEATLADIFVRGHDIRDLAVRPHERIALMRLFLCIAHAALDGPGNREEWEDCLASLPAAAGSYLKQWETAFELFGESQRFLQVPNLQATKAEEDEGNSVSKLDMALATGNNPTLFDNSGGGGRTFPPDQLALALLTFQCFSPGGTIGVALWNKQPTLGWKSYPKPAPGQSGHAPCLPGSMLHAFPRGANLLATIHLNLLPRDTVVTLPGITGWGRPVWEQMPSTPADEAFISNAAQTYLGRLVPISRAIRMDNDGRGLLLANGMDYPSWPEAREVSATIIVRTVKGQPDRFTLGASLDKAPWRELHALTVKSAFMKDAGGPLALNNLAGDQPFDLWVGALVADKAKVLDTVEGVYHVPATMLASTGQQRYADGVQFAEQTAWALKRAVTRYHAEIGDKLDRPDARNRRDALQNKATFQFWTQVERELPLLLAAVQSADPLPDATAWRRSRWGRIVSQAARLAYETACPHETGRQLQAFVKGLAVLFPNSTNQPN